MPVDVKNDSEKSSPLFKGELSACVFLPQRHRGAEKIKRSFFLLFLFSLYPPLCL